MPAEGLSCTDCPNPKANPTITTTYFVTGKNADGCDNSDSVTVYAAEACGNHIFVPDAFSPNADGQNDVLLVNGCLQIEAIIFHIYDRWGRRIFESLDIKNGWDGKYLGRECNTDVFT